VKSGERAPDDDWTHPLCGTWEHLQPETTEVTLAAVFVNSMKTNLTEMQFRQITVELVRVWSSSGSTFEPSFVPRGPWRGVGRPGEITERLPATWAVPCGPLVALGVWGGWDRRTYRGEVTTVTGM
jgi:hypothetical protein